MVGRGQPWLEVAPETSNGEGFRAASVEDPHRSKENDGDGQSNSGQEDDQWRSAWALGFSVQSRDNNGLNVPVIVGCTVTCAGCTATDCTTANGVTDDGHLNGSSIADRCLEFKVP